MTPEPVNIVCFGDSITHGAEFAPHERWTSILQERLDAWRPATYRVHNCGIGGNTSTQGFDRFGSEVLPLLPGVLLVQFGFNDANVPGWSLLPRVSVGEYLRNLREFHRAATANNSTCIFVINHAIPPLAGSQGNNQRYDVNYAPYARALRELVAELQAPAIDLPAEMQRKRVRLEEFVAEDKIHLSIAGNRQYADMVFGSLANLLAERVSAASN